MTGDLVHFPALPNPISSAEARLAAERILLTPFSERLAKAGQLRLDQSETFLALCQLLDNKMEASPATVYDEARFFYDLLKGENTPESAFLFDERAYYLGQFAFQVGSACRFLSRRDEATDWFDCSEAWFLLTANAAGDIGRLAYQRLALKMEQRKFDEVLRIVPVLAEGFSRTNASELALKCRFLEGQVLKETNRLGEALSLFQEISYQARALGNERLLAQSSVDLIQLHATFGEAEKALALAAETSSLLRRLNNRVGLAKLQWGLANLLRTRGKLPEAIQTYRAAQDEFAEIGMRADIAAIHLVVADLLLESGQERQAEWEIRAALPVIDELKMVPEGVAALSLLRESVRRRKIDRQALRDLHGYFREG